MTLDGYPGLERFFLPAAGLTCVLGGGSGVVRLVACSARGRGPERRLAADRVVARRALAVAPGRDLDSVHRPARINQAARGRSRSRSQAVTRLNQLTAAVAAVGGHDAVFPCQSSFAAVNHSRPDRARVEAARDARRVGTSMRHQGVMFVGPHDSIDGGAPSDRPPAEPQAS